MLRKKYIPKHAKEKQKFHLPLSAWLSYLVVATLLFGSVSLAKYTTSTTDGDGARVAKFEVTATPDNVEGQTDKIVLSTTELNSVAYALTVKNTSEVVASYKIIVKNVPKGIDVSVNDSAALMHDENGTVTYVAENVLDIGATKNCTITFKAHDEYTKAEKYEEQMIVEVRFDQVD